MLYIGPLNDNKLTSYNKILFIVQQFKSINIVRVILSQRKFSLISKEEKNYKTVIIHFIFHAN